MPIGTFWHHAACVVTDQKHIFAHIQICRFRSLSHAVFLSVLETKNTTRQHKRHTQGGVFGRSRLVALGVLCRYMVARVGIVLFALCRFALCLLDKLHTYTQTKRERAKDKAREGESMKEDKRHKEHERREKERERKRERKQRTNNKGQTKYEKLREYE